MLLDRLNGLLAFLAAHPQHHARDSAFYRFLEPLLKSAIAEARARFEAGEPVTIAELGPIALPYKRMGAVDSLDLFGLDELLIFAFYLRNRGRYRRAADIGANIGLHSIVLGKCGIPTEAYEPDPQHHDTLVRNLAMNGVASCEAHRAAVSERDGAMQFVRVLGNTTSSHLAGAKANPYGELERFDVEVRDIKPIAGRVDLFKIDAEGHEAVLLSALDDGAWRHCDAFVEIGTPENACAVHERFAGSEIGVFSQKRGWARASSLEDLPVSYKEGGVFVSAKPVMPW